MKQAILAVKENKVTVCKRMLFNSFGIPEHINWTVNKIGMLKKKKIWQMTE